jgi:uncharacterized protein
MKSDRKGTTQLLTGALVLFGTLLLQPITSASAQVDTVPSTAPQEPARDQIQPPLQAGDPSIRASWELTGPAAGQITDDGSYLTVTGTAEIEAPSDRARIHFAVETDGESARDAGAANAQLMTSVSDALREAGGTSPGFRLETSGYSVTPRYGPPRGSQPQEIVGYVARNTVQVRVDDVELVGPLIDAALEAGANRIAGLYFDVSDPEPYRHEAVRSAVTRARSEAVVIAEALGMALGPPVEVNGGADTFLPRPAFTAGRAMEMADAFATPVEAGAQTLSARVTIRFRLDPGS